MEGIGIIGTGQISTVYLSNLIDRFHLPVRAIAARNLEKTKKVAARWTIDACTLDELLRREDLSTILLLTPAYTHFELGKAVLENGKHLYSEKTLTLTSKEAKELEAIAQSKQLKIGCAPDTFLGPAVQFAKQILTQGKLGRITSFSIQMTRCNPQLMERFTFLKQMGGGIAYDLGIYALTNLIECIGPVNKVSCFSLPIGMLNDNLEDVDPTIEQIAVATLEMASGCIGSLHLNGLATKTEQPFFQIHGNFGTLSLPDPNQFGGVVTLLSDYPHSVKESYQFDNENLRGIGVKNFYESLESTDNRSYIRAYHCLDILECLILSSQTAKVVFTHSKELFNDFQQIYHT